MASAAQIRARVPECQRLKMLQPVVQMENVESTQHFEAIGTIKNAKSTGQNPIATYSEFACTGLYLACMRYVWFQGKRNGLIAVFSGKDEV